MSSMWMFGRFCLPPKTVILPRLTRRRRFVASSYGVEIADDIELPAGVTELSAIEQFTALHVGSALYADIRSAAPSAGVQRWEVAAPARLRLRGRLTSAGAAWSAEA